MCNVVHVRFSMISLASTASRRRVVAGSVDLLVETQAFDRDRRGAGGQSTGDRLGRLRVADFGPGGLGKTVDRPFD